MGSVMTVTTTCISRRGLGLQRVRTSSVPEKSIQLGSVEAREAWKTSNVLFLLQVYKHPLKVGPYASLLSIGIQPQA